MLRLVARFPYAEMGGACAVYDERERGRQHQEELQALASLALRLRWGTQWYLDYKKQRPPRTLPYAYAYGPMGVLGGWAVSYERGTPLWGV